MSFINHKTNTVVETEVNSENSEVVSFEDEAKKVHEISHEKTISSDEELHLEEPKKHSEIYKQAWSKKLLMVAYGVLIFTAFVETFAGDSTSGLDSYATSAFNALSLITTASVVYHITAIVSYPLVAKLADFFGRSEGFGFAVTIYTLAYVLYAACPNAQTFVAGQIFYGIGRVGYRVFQQTFIADTTSLINRGLWAQLPDCVAAVPSLYVGSVIQDAFIDHSTWRWGFGVWAIALAATCIPLTGIMYILDKRAKQTGEEKIIAILQEMPPGTKLQRTWWFLFKRLDLIGGCLLTLGFSLFFIPLTLTGTKSTYRWHEPKLIVMLCIGVVVFVGFLLWNGKHMSKKLDKRPFVQPQSFAHNTIIIACVITSLELCVNSNFSSYFKTVLQVSGYYTVGEATRIDSAKKVCYQLLSVLTGLAMKYTKKAKIYTLCGLPLLLLGQGLLAYFIDKDDKMAKTSLLYMAEVFIGIGRGMYQCSLLVIIQGIAGSEGIPMSTAFFLAFQSTGSLIGDSISGGIWNTIVLRKLHKYLPLDETKKASKIYKSIKVAMKYKKGTETRDAIAKLYRETEQLIGYVSLGMLVPLLVLMWFVRDIKLTSHNDIYATDSESESVLIAEPSDETVEQSHSVKKRYRWIPSFQF